MQTAAPPGALVRSDDAGTHPCPLAPALPSQRAPSRRPPAPRRPRHSELGWAGSAVPRRPQTGPSLQKPNICDQSLPGSNTAARMGTERDLQSVHYEGQGLQGSPRPTSVLCSFYPPSGHREQVCSLPPDPSRCLKPFLLLLQLFPRWPRPSVIFTNHNSFPCTTQSVHPRHTSNYSRPGLQALFLECKCPQQKKSHLKL